MKIHSVQYPVFNPYNDSTIEIYVLGCFRKCKGCHNPELGDFNGEGRVVDESFFEYLQERAFLFNTISVTGGDLLCQSLEEAKSFSLELNKKFPTKKLWLFTGEDDFNNVPSWAKDTYDVIKYGKYDKNFKKEGFPSSSNQKVYKKGDKI